MAKILVCNKGVIPTDDYERIFNYLAECGLTFEQYNRNIEIRQGDGTLVCILYKIGAEKLAKWLNQAIEEMRE